MSLLRVAVVGLALLGCASAPVATPSPDAARTDAVDAPTADLVDGSRADILDAALTDLVEAFTGDVVSRADVGVRTDAAAPRVVEVTAYYAAWMQQAVPPSVIDFSQITLLQHFSLVPRADGTLDGDENVLTTANARAAVAAAHTARRRVLVSVGGANTLTGFRGAWGDARRDAFIARIVRFVTDHGYDGVDIDVEPLTAEDVPAFRVFVRALRRALDAARPGATLTAAAVPYLSIDAPGETDDHFVSYDDPRSAAEKVRWARAQGLRSVILWELGGAWRASQPAGSRDAMLRAIGEAAAVP